MPENSSTKPTFSRRNILQAAAAGIAGVGLSSLPGTLAPAAAAVEPALPKWAIGPFTRYEGNPILTPQGTGFESLQAFNPGVVEREGKYSMLYRGGSPGQISEIGLATSDDGFHFKRHSKDPIIGRTLPNESHAIEDPRLFFLDGTYYTFYTAFNGSQIDLNMAVSQDAVHWKKLGPIFPGTKNAAVVTDPRGRPVKFDGRYLMYYGQAGSGTFLGESEDMIHWSTVGPVDLHLPITGAPYEVCVAVTNYPTVHGGDLNRDILVFIAGRMQPQGTWVYAISETAYSRIDPTRQIGHLDTPIFVPASQYEILGVTPNTVFMNSILFNGNRWLMHYGAGDTVTALATASLRDPGSRT